MVIFERESNGIERKGFTGSNGKLLQTGADLNVHFNLPNRVRILIHF
jgi:hypothetical protein